MATVLIAPDQEVDVVAVHLDFAGHDTRSSEVEEMGDALSGRFPKRPLVVMGDFNSEWLDDRSVVRDFAERLDLTTWEPESREIVTFPDFGARLDYILVSAQLEIASHAVLSDAVSDHRAVVARIGLKRP